MSKILFLYSMSFFLGCASVLGCASKPATSLKERRPASESLKFEYQKGELIAACKAAIAKADERYKAIAALKPEARTMDSTILAAEEASTALYDEALTYIFMKNVHLNEGTRQESQDCSVALSEFDNDVSTRRDLYLAIKDQKGRNPDEKRLATEMIKEFEENGMKLSDEGLKKYRELSVKLSNLELEFAANNRNDTSEALFMESELPGLRPDYLGSLKKNELGQVKVPTRATDYLEVMQRVSNAESRKKMLGVYNRRGGAANIALLEQALLIRQEIAALLGYKNWADYRISDRMAKNSTTVMSFLNGLRKKLSAQNRVDMNELLKFKKELEPGATVVNQWDNDFLSYQLQSKSLAINLDEVREYFPVDVVIEGMLKVYSEMLSVNFREIAQPKAWASEVKQFEVTDKKDGRLIGFVYLDLFGRPGKYTHAACTTLTKGRRLKDGSYNIPVAAVYANFSKPTDSKPSLLTFANRGEVVTLFHEFGHAMHATLTRAPYASMSGTAVKRDFVELPSQMLENWVYDVAILNRLSGHYLDHSKKIPPQMIKSLIDLKNFQQARFYTRQLLLGTFDMTINMQKGAVNTVGMFDKFFKDITGQEQMTGLQFPASFGHLMGGYDAGYYGYLWSNVYAEDIFTVFKKSGLLNPATGLKYRSVILERGDMEDPMDLLTRFLGRKPNQKAFLQTLGIKNP